MLAKGKSTGKRVSARKDSDATDREVELLAELNRDAGSAPAQLLGSNVLAIKIRGVISLQCPTLDKAIGRGGIPLGRLTLLHGKEGCLAGETLVRVDDGSGEVERPILEMPDAVAERFKDREKGVSPFLIRTMIDDTGETGKVWVKNAWCSGERMLYRVTVESGQFVRATSNHRFLTIQKDRAAWRSLFSLRVGDQAFVGARAARPLRVTSIVEEGVEAVFDISTAFPNSYLANEYVVHNSGKTTLALHAVAETQRLTGMVIYADAEHKLDPDYASKIGVDLNRLVIVQPDYVENFLLLIERTINVAKRHREAGQGFPVLVVLDSINALPTKAEFDGGWEQQFMGSAAGVYSAKLKKLMPMVSREDIALLFISQEREKIGVMFGKKETTGAGKAPRYYSSLILEVSRHGSVTRGEETIGNEITVKCSKNQIAPPFRNAEFRMLFDRGIDYNDALFREATRVGLITSSGGWYRFADLKWHGEDTVRDAIATDEVKARLKEALGL